MAKQSFTSVWKVWDDAATKITVYGGLGTVRVRVLEPPIPVFTLYDASLAVRSSVVAADCSSDVAAAVPPRKVLVTAACRVRDPCDPKTSASVALPTRVDNVLRIRDVLG